MNRFLLGMKKLREDYVKRAKIVSGKYNTHLDLIEFMISSITEVIDEFSFYEIKKIR